MWLMVDEGDQRRRGVSEVELPLIPKSGGLPLENAVRHKAAATCHKIARHLSQNPKPQFTKDQTHSEF